MTSALTPGSLRDDLRQAVASSVRLNDQLEIVLPIPVRRLPSEHRHGKISSSPVPWYSAAAWLILELHSEARDMEARLRICASQPVRQRGGSSQNTAKALEAVLAVAWAVDDGRVKECVQWLDRWCGRARVALGEKDQPRRLPRLPGKNDPACPYCSARTLRFWALTGVVACINPACKLEDGRKPSAHMEFSPLAGDWVLQWADKTVGVPV